MAEQTAVIDGTRYVLADHGMGWAAYTGSKLDLVAGFYNSVEELTAALKDLSK